MPRVADPVVAPGAMSAREQPTVSRNGLVLRPFTLADVPTLVAAYAEASIQRWHVTSLTDAEAEEWIASRRELWREEKLANWAVTVDSIVVGRVGLKSIDLEQGSPRSPIGYSPNTDAAATQNTRWRLRRVGRSTTSGCTVSS